MKKIWVIFPVLLLVCAGMVMMGCSSDDPGPDNPNNEDPGDEETEDPDWGKLTLGNLDGVVGKGDLSAEDTAKIRGLPNGKIVFNITVTVNTTNAQPGYGVCGVGGWNDNNSYSIKVPSNATQGPLTFDAEVKISDITAKYPSGNIVINPYNGAIVNKAEIIK